MLAKNADRTCTYFAIDYEPLVGPKLGELAGQICAKYKPDNLGMAIPTAYSFGWPGKKSLLTMGVKRIAWQSLGLSQWQERLKDDGAMFRSSIEVLGVKEIKRIGFKVTAFLPLQMSHAELCNLMFGSFMAPLEELETVLGHPKDPLFHVEGEYDGFEYLLDLTAVSKAQITQAFHSIPNLDHFVSDKFLDCSLRDFHDRIAASDCVSFDIDLFQKNVAAASLETFLKSSFSKAEEMADKCVRRLQCKPLKA